MIRAFIAVDIPESVRRDLKELIDGLRPYGGSSVRWVPPENIHVTLKFLGNIEESQVGIVESAIREGVKNQGPFVLEARGTGAFPSIKRMRVLWAGLQGDILSLARVQSSIEGVLEKQGFEREKREFKPHLTIGRIKGSSFDRRLAKKLVEYGTSFRSGPFEIEKVTLYRSILKPSGAKYEPLVSVFFTG